MRDEPGAEFFGRYWHHQRTERPATAVDDPGFPNPPRNTFHEVHAYFH